MKILQGFIVLIFCLATILSSQSPFYNIRDFGAAPNTGVVCTHAIQSAINACAENGGGTVLIPAGEFVSGTLHLQDNVNLHLDAGAILKGSANIADYQSPRGIYGLIRAWEKRNISITGYGEINGNGTIFFDPNKPHWGPDFDRQYTRQGDSYMSFADGIQDGPIAYEQRPNIMVELLRCENIRIENIILRDSPSWTFRLGDCDGAVVRGISIDNNLLVPNSDGVHCTTSRNVRISDCNMRCGDDTIIVSGLGEEITVGAENVEPDYARRRVGNKTGLAENVVVTNCSLVSRSAGIRVGYGVNSIRNCIFSNLVITDSNRGLGLFTREQGSIENILFADITIRTRLHTGHWWGHGEPIHLSAIAQTKTTPAAPIKHVRFRNILAQSESGIVIYSEKPEEIQDVALEDVQLELRSGDLWQSYGGNFDLRPVADLKDGIFKHDIPGLYAQNVRDLRISNFKLESAEKLVDYFANGVECVGVTGLRLSGISSSAQMAGEAIRLIDCREVERTTP